MKIYYARIGVAIIIIHFLTHFESYKQIMLNQDTQNKAIQAISNILYYPCSIVYRSDMCHGMIDNYFPTLLQNTLIYLLTTPIKSNFTMPSTYKQPSQLILYEPDINVTNYTFTVLTDLHADLKYKENATSDCNSIICCRDYVKGDHKNASKWGKKGKCGLPFPTFKELVDQLPSNTLFLLGDFPPHDAWERTMLNTFDEAQRASNILKMKYKGKYAVYPVLGNHEGFPVDHLNMSNSSYLLQTYANMWEEWLTEDALTTFRKFGFYSQRHNNTNVVIIVLNSLYYELLNSYLWADRTIIDTQLIWLANELNFCKSNNLSAIILGHIPIAHYYTMPEFYEGYTKILERFGDVVKAQFFGHTHADHFQVFRLENNSTPGVCFVSPPMTSFKCDPSYREYLFDLQYNLIDYNQYKAVYLDDGVKWAMNYSFKEYYNLKQNDVINGDYMKMLSDNAMNDAELMKKMLLRMSKGEKNVTKLEEDYLVCVNLKSSHPFDFWKCASKKLNIRTIVTSMVSDMLELK